MQKACQAFLFCIAFFFFSTCYACSTNVLNETLSQVKELKTQLERQAYNHLYLEALKIEVEKMNKGVEDCHEDTMRELKKQQLLLNNTNLLKVRDDSAQIYEKKISTILETQRFETSVWNEIESVLSLIDKQIDESKKNRIKEEQIISIPQLIKNYDSHSPKLIIKDNFYLYGVELYKYNKLLFSFLAGSSLLGLLIGCFLFFKSYQVINTSKNSNLILFLSHLKWVLPIFLFIMPIDFIGNQDTKDWITQPPVLKFLDFIFRNIIFYILSLFAICFLVSNKFNKQSLIVLLKQTSLFFFFGILLQMIFLVCLEQTNFSALVYLCVYVPIYYFTLFYFSYRWAFVPSYPENENQFFLYRLILLVFFSVYIIIRLVSVYSGYLDYTAIQFVLLLVILYYYYKFYHFQTHLSAYISKKQLKYLNTMQNRFFGKVDTSIYEFKLILFIIDVYLFIFFIMILLNLLNFSIDAKSAFYHLIYTPIKFGNIDITFIKLVNGLTFFSLFMLSERYVSNYFYLRHNHHKNINIFLTKRNFIHYTNMVVGFFIALIIAGFPSTYLAVIFGGISLGAGFGLQFIVENLISGLLIVVKNEFLVGDFVKLLNLNTGDTVLEGKILYIHSLETTILDTEDVHVIIPNSTLLKNGVRKQRLK